MGNAEKCNLWQKPKKTVDSLNHDSPLVMFKCGIGLSVGVSGRRTNGVGNRTRERLFQLGYK